MFLWTGILCAQKQPFKKLSFSANISNPTELGDNFLNEGYSSNNGYDFAAQFYFVRHVFAGFQVKSTELKIENRNLIGDFSSGSSTSKYFIVGYEHQIIPKTFLEYRLGFGSCNISNYSPLSSYSLSGGSFLIGIKCDYHFIPQISVYAGLDYTTSKFNIELKGPYKDFYNKAADITPTLGLRFSFWKNYNK